MCVALEMSDGLLPVCRKDVFVLARQSLVNLDKLASPLLNKAAAIGHTLAQGPVYSSAGAKPCVASYRSY